VISPSIDPHKLSIEDKIRLVRESDGLLVELLEGLEVRGYLNLGGCTSLNHLPDGLKVEGDLDLYGCTSLNHLPDGLKVEGNLDLYGCTSLIHLPDDLEVGGNLYPLDLKVRAKQLLKEIK